VSDVRALAEIVEHGVTGLVHRRDDADSLADALAECIARPELRVQLGQRAAAWTREHRSWPRIAADVDAVYRGLIDS
jgi:glycosyltransferase involved in cell wall biosynthesis